MLFPYTINDVEKCILETESELRKLVISILDREYGKEWEINPIIGFTKSKKDTLEWRKKQQKEKNPHANLTERLVDYSYPLDLRDIFQKNKQLFEPIFVLWEQHMAMLEILNNLRNLVFHTRDVILDSQKHLTLGVCGEFLHAIKKWQSELARKILEYSCDLMFEEKEGKDVEQAKTKAIDLAKTWQSKIDSLGTILGEEEIPGRGKAYKLKLKEGVAKITFPKTSQQYYGFLTQAARIHVRSDNFTVFDKILKAGSHPYWVLEWKIANSLDVNSVINKISELTGRYPPSKSGTGSGSSTHWGVADYYILNDPEATVRVSLQEIDDKTAQISLICHSKEPNQGFTHAHEVFSPDKIMSILYAQTQVPEVRALVQESYKR